jgi:ABC-type nickel/cobalt efflux system permease component RcnA
MIETALPLALLLGIVSGFRHAFEPDHVVAVSTLINGDRAFGRSVRLGLVWGAGHTTTLVIGVMVIGLLRLPVSEETLGWFELPVAAMLIGLGLWSLRDAVRPRGRQEPTHHAREGWAGYGVGLVHGMAGSGALLLLVAATLPTLAAGVGYAVLYGLGSILGMGAVTLALSVPLRAARTQPMLYRVLVGLAGALSIGLGILILANAL